VKKNLRATVMQHALCTSHQLYGGGNENPSRMSKNLTWCGVE